MSRPAVTTVLPWFARGPAPTYRLLYFDRGWGLRTAEAVHFWAWFPRAHPGQRNWRQR